LVLLVPVNGHTWYATDSFGYTGVAPDTYSWVDVLGWTPTGLRDDEIITVPLGFPFYYYGVPRATVTISSNGWIGFDTYTATYPFDAPMPDPGDPNNIICPIWDNLEPQNTGAEVYYATIGTGSNRVFGVTWLNVPRHLNQGSVTIQVLLYEGSNDIRFQYRRIRNEQNDGRLSTTGIENADGSDGLQYNNRTPGKIYDELAILFTLGSIPSPTPSPSPPPTATPLPVDGKTENMILLLTIGITMIGCLFLRPLCSHRLKLIALMWALVLTLSTPVDSHAQTILFEDDFDSGFIDSGPGYKWSDESDLWPTDPDGIRASDDFMVYGAILAIDDFGAVGNSIWRWPCSAMATIDQYLITNPVDCTGMSSITVNYDLKYRVDFPDDRFSIHYRLVPGGPWTVIHEYPIPGDQYYTDESYPIPAATNEPFLQVAFRYMGSTDCSFLYTWYVIDEVSILADSSATPLLSPTPTTALPTDTPTPISSATPSPTPPATNTPTAVPDIPTVGTTGIYILLGMITSAICVVTKINADRY
jgi:hypothetical protein